MSALWFLLLYLPLGAWWWAATRKSDAERLEDDAEQMRALALERRKV